MLQNAYFLAKIGADTAENEQHFAEILPIGRRRPRACPSWRMCVQLEGVDDRQDVEEAEEAKEQRGHLLAVNKG